MSRKFISSNYIKKVVQLLSLSIILFTISCSSGGFGGSKPQGTSNTTGWKYNDPVNGGFEYSLVSSQTTGPGLTLIEGGTFVMGRVTEEITYEWNNEPRRVTVPSFYMDITEVKNIDYREYIHWLKRVYTNYPEVARKSLPDTLVWLTNLGFNDNYVENYFRHPAYNEYPVVGVNWLQANDYCDWRTDRVNERILISNNILVDNPQEQQDENNFNTGAYLAGQYEGAVGQNLPDLSSTDGGTRPVRWTDGLLLPKYRLPTEAEWEYAAYGYYSSNERVRNKKAYPWKGNSLRNPDLPNRGRMQANFVRGRGDLMGVAGDLNDGGDITVPVNSYWPNDFGLYCMAGNVNEWVMDVYRDKSSLDVDEFSPFRGNVFEVTQLDEEGNIAEKDSLGRIKRRTLTEEDIRNTSNPKISKANNINFLDGSIESSIVDDQLWTNPEHENRLGTGAMYSPTNSLISDRSRVYKGGSWRDRAYWLSPGTRRFLDERKATSDIGFRCAMTKVGGSSSPNASK